MANALVDGTHDAIKANTHKAHARGDTLRPIFITARSIRSRDGRVTSATEAVPRPVLTGFGHDLCKIGTGLLFSQHSLEFGARDEGRAVHQGALRRALGTHACISAVGRRARAVEDHAWDLVSIMVRRRSCPLPDHDETSKQPGESHARSFAYRLLVPSR
jgi:hypothetical protein